MSRMNEAEKTLRRQIKVLDQAYVAYENGKKACECEMRRCDREIKNLKDLLEAFCDE